MTNRLEFTVPGRAIPQPETCGECRFCRLNEGYEGDPVTIRCLIDAEADQYEGEDTPSCKAGIKVDDE